mgnify:CR=1 FL=1
MSAAVGLNELLAELGYGHPEALQRATGLLVAEGLTTGKKPGIAAEKRPRVRELLGRRLYRLCDRCRDRIADEDRPIVPVLNAGDCERCGGSPNRAAVNEAARAMRAIGARNLLIVGGGPGVHSELRSLWPADIEMRVVSGDERHDAKLARSLLNWAHVVVVWGSTILPHRVSGLYTVAGGPMRRKVFTVPRRSIEALARGVADHCAMRR